MRFRKCAICVASNQLEVEDLEYFLVRDVRVRRSELVITNADILASVILKPNQCLYTSNIFWKLVDIVEWYACPVRLVIAWRRISVRCAVYPVCIVVKVFEMRFEVNIRARQYKHSEANG